MGAAGRDFHDFLVFLRRRPEFRVRAFTAAQIPFIDRRSFPARLAGPPYDEDIPIRPESELSELIAAHDIDVVFLAYSDLSHAEVMHRASLVQSQGAAFALLGPKQTQLDCPRPVVAVTGVRTGVGKSPLSQWLAARLSATGRRVAVVRHPMPYGDLAAEAVQRFAVAADLDRERCTIEEREEYAPYVARGQVVFAGVDYERVVAAAAAECDVLLWDGGNNDTPFVRPDLWIVVADALRPGHEIGWHPGETNFRAADAVVIAKVSADRTEAVRTIREHARLVNPRAAFVESSLGLVVDAPKRIAGRRVLVVEDGPTITHGGMSSGAGMLAAQVHVAAEIVDPRPFAVGSIAAAFRDFPHIGPVLPALGYSAGQRDELRCTIAASGAEVVVDASPAAVVGTLGLEVPVVRVGYEFVQTSGPHLLDLVEGVLSGRSSPDPR